MTTITAANADRFDPYPLPRCCTCDKKVERVRLYSPAMMESTIRVVVECHNAFETYDIPVVRAVVFGGHPVLEPLAFLRPVASYGAVSNDARRERRARLRHG